MTAITTQKKGRTLQELIDQQVREGKLDPNELEKPVDWTQRTRSFNKNSKKWSYNDGGEVNSSSQQLNWQQRQLFENDGKSVRTSQPYNNTSKPGKPNSFAQKNPSDLPAWALDINNNDTKQGTMNWQQEGLMSRDESNPFTRFVRGEDEYCHE